MKNIIFKIQEYPRFSETFITTQVVTAISLGFHVQILVKNLLPVKKSRQESIIEKYGLCEKIITEDYRIPKNKVFRLLKWVYLLFINVFNLLKILEYHRIQNEFSLTWLYQFCFFSKLKDTEIFHIQYGTNKHPLDILKRIGVLKGKIMVSFHGHDAFFPINGYIENHNYYKDLFNVANTVIANTPYLAKQIEAIGCNSKKIKTIPISVNTDFFYSKQREKKVNKTFKIISVGRLAEVKGHIYALKAILRLNEMGCNVFLTIVGEGEERKALLKFVKDNNIEHLVELVGIKSQSEIRQLFWENNLFLFPSISLEGGRAETQGLATIEAQACGLPVVAFNTGGIPYTIKENTTGYLCEEFDYNGMADKIKYLINTPDVLYKMSVNASRFIKECYAKKEIDETWNILYNQTYSIANE
ncbi:glycosyltransferase [Seonamhaeicola marinus]|uniref:Colanic acid biosynthesis glycosyltransferase WcaL n=1 Tax=Seonamhaeicola marinus TaxID=1912246 RepID=A0A5D0HJ34_9FLAO|nr:glycosyltransferase [Seonamhaeicola marinus]TYA71414.1 colanic acid biosynthesis glycosyltransferase WcaL [Seonamhaeicola marinus]